MPASIQEIIKKINTRINTTFSGLDLVSITLSGLIISFGCIYLGLQDTNTVRYPLIYHEGKVEQEKELAVGNQIIASKNGKTYFFSWCKGVDRIKEVNKVYFENEVSAQETGRTLSKTCTK